MEKLILAGCSCGGSGNVAMTILVTAIVFMMVINLNNIRKGGPFLMKHWKIVVLLLLVAVVAAVVIMKKGGASSPMAVVDANNNVVLAGTDSNMPSSAAIPKLVDLGAGKCVPCKMMKPILDELKTEYKGRLDVIFYDVWENPDQSKKFGINVIPTQIFFDATGKELFRHEGFMAKSDILAKYKELGVNLEKEQSNGN